MGRANFALATGYRLLRYMDGPGLVTFLVARDWRTSRETARSSRRRLDRGPRRVGMPATMRRTDPAQALSSSKQSTACSSSRKGSPPPLEVGESDTRGSAHATNRRDA